MNPQYELSDLNPEHTYKLYWTGDDKRIPARSRRKHPPWRNILVFIMAIISETYKLFYHFCCFSSPQVKYIFKKKGFYAGTLME